MKIHVLTPPTIYAARWFRRYATALIVVALIAVATLGAGLARALYTNVAPRAIAPLSSVTTDAALDQHERHAAGFAQIETLLDQHERHAPVSNRKPAPSQRDTWWIEQ